MNTMELTTEQARLLTENIRGYETTSGGMRLLIREQVKEELIEAALKVYGHDTYAINNNGNELSLLVYTEDDSSE